MQLSKVRLKYFEFFYFSCCTDRLTLYWLNKQIDTSWSFWRKCIYYVWVLPFWNVSTSWNVIIFFSVDLNYTDYHLGSYGKTGLLLSILLIIYSQRFQKILNLYYNNNKYLYNLNITKLLITIMFITNIIN